MAERKKKLSWSRRKKRAVKPPNPAFLGRSGQQREKGECPGPDSPAPQLLHSEAQVRDRRELILKERLDHGGRGGGRRREKQEATAVGSARGGIHRRGNGNPAQPSRPCRQRGRRSVLTPTGTRRPLRSWRQTAAQPISARSPAGGGLFFFKPPLPPRAPRPVGTAAPRPGPAHGGCLASLWTNRNARKPG